jgi:insulysin
MDLKLEISQNDDRKYKYIKLSNDLEVLLIHDPSTEKSSACCDVHIGSMADPNEAQGFVASSF